MFFDLQKEDEPGEPDCVYEEEAADVQGFGSGDDCCDGYCA